MSTAEKAAPAANKVFDPSVASLMNNGVEVWVNRIRQTEVEDVVTGEKYQEWEAVPGQRVLIKIKFTARVIANLEMKFGSMGQWQAMLDQQGTRCLLDSFVIITNKDVFQVSAMLDTTATEEYQMAMMTAWLVSMGAAPDDLGKMVGSALKLGRAKDMIIKAITQSGTVGDSLVFPGNPGSETGSEPVEHTTDSGNQDLPKSSTSSKTISTNRTPKKK